MLDHGDKMSGFVLIARSDLSIWQAQKSESTVEVSSGFFKASVWEEYKILRIFFLWLDFLGREIPDDVACGVHLFADFFFAPPFSSFQFSLFGLCEVACVLLQSERELIPQDFLT